MHVIAEVDFFGPTGLSKRPDRRWSLCASGVFLIVRAAYRKSACCIWVHRDAVVRDCIFSGRSASEAAT